MSSVNNNIPFVPENTVDPAAGLNQAINVIDALLQVRVLTLGDNSPPSAPAEGDRYIVGTAPTGNWAGHANKLARWQSGGWEFYGAAIAVNVVDNSLWVSGEVGWVKLAALA